MVKKIVKRVPGDKPAKEAPAAPAHKPDWERGPRGRPANPSRTPSPPGHSKGKGAR